MRLLFAVWVLAMLPAIALAEFSNYTSVLTYDEISLDFLNNTNITISNASASESWNRTEFSEIPIEENSTEVSIHSAAYTTVKTFNVFQNIYSVKGDIRESNVGGCPSETGYSRVKYTYNDSTTQYSEIIGTTSTSDVAVEWNNPDYSKSVDTIEIQLDPYSNCPFYTNDNEVLPFMKLPMADISARGNSNIQVSTAGYKTRIYIETLEDTSQINITAYLLANADATLINFQTIDQLGTVISGATMTIEKLINNTWTGISKGETDGSGSYGIYLKIGESYRVVTEKEAFTTNTVTLMITSTNYIIRLSQETTADFDHMFENLFYEMLPPINELRAQENQTVSWTVNSSDSQIIDYALKVVHPNGTVLYSSSDTESAGGNLTANLNLTGYAHRVRLRAYGNFTKAGYPTFWVNRSLYLNNYTMGNRTLYGILPDFDGEDGLGTLAKTIVSLTIITVVAGGAAGSVGGLGAGAIALALLGFFTFAGWFSGTLFIGIMLLVIGIYVLKRGY